MAAIFVASAQSNPPVPPVLPDKVLHAIAYFGFGILVFRAVARRFPARVTWRRAAASLAITIAYGVTDELHQLAVPSRSADALDLAADAIGASLALVACWAWGIIRTRPHVPTDV